MYSLGMKKICELEGCSNFSRYKKGGVCNKHQQLFYRHGDYKNRYDMHGMYGTPIYKVWDAMVQRCTNKNNKYYYNYGGRGIIVEERWLKFVNFYKDMGDRPSSKHSIERVDNNKGYNVGNCVWATKDIQQHNRRARSSTGYKGVYNSKSKYVAQIQKNYKRMHLGIFNTAYEASLAYNQASEKLYNA